MFKKFLVFTLALLLCLSLSGCADVKMKTTLKSNGEITSAVYLDLSEIQNRVLVYDVCVKYFKGLDNAYEENMLSLFSNKYDFDAMNLNNNSDKMSYIQLNNLKFIADAFNEDDQPYIQAIQNNFSSVWFKRKFVSIYAYLMYFAPSVFEYDEESDKIIINKKYSSLIDVPMSAEELVENKGFFINNFVQKCNPFYYDNAEPRFLYDCSVSGLGETINILAGDSLAQLLSELIDCEENGTLEFSFTTPFKRLHSNGTIIETEQGFTHFWALGSIDTQILIWRNYANYITWYSLAGLIGILIVIFGVLGIYILNNKKKRTGLKALQKIDNFNLSQRDNLKNSDQDKTEK